MKVVTVILASILWLQTEGYLIKVPTSTLNTRVATEGGWVHIQKLLLPLFENVCEESAEPTIVRLNEEFNLDPSSGVYLKPDVVSNFQNLKASKGLLAKGEIFTEQNADHLNELKVIYELLYYARDFDTFYKAACWARQNLNCGLFVDAIYLAILNRRDTEKVSIPAPYEILPNYFIRKGYVIKASSLIQGNAVPPCNCVRNEGNSYILDANYTTSYNDDGDDKLAYFHEDVGLNSYYFLTKLNTLPWLNDSQRKNSGLYMYHMMKQMMARYNLERYSNGLPELEGLDWANIDKTDYDPLLIYSNGNDFTPRLSANIGNSDIVTALRNIEGNLESVVVHMRDVGYSKSDIVNQLMDILVTSEKSYLNIALQFLSDDGLVSRYPTVLEHYMTSIRDPLYWKLNKKIVDLVDDALKVLPSYSRNELYFPGVEVQNIEAKKMQTTFDNFKFDVTSAFKTEKEVSKFDVKISQPRLNSKPFSFKITVSSLVAQKALVKIYIGPKAMPGELVENKNLFMLMDNFEVNLKIGSNILSRASSEMTNISEDLISLEYLHKLVLDAEFGVDALPLTSVWSQIKFPSRLILPKGTSEGLPVSVFVFIAPYVKATIGGSRANMELNREALTPGYPLDLNIEIQQLFNLPNAIVKDISIIHKSESSSYNKPAYDYNANSRSWPIKDEETDTPTGPLHLSSRPEFTKKTFEYKSQNKKYEIKTDNTANLNDYTYQKEKFKVDKFGAEEDTRKVITDIADNKLDGDSKAWVTEDVISDVPKGPLYLSARPEFTKKTFDYKSKKNQYGKKTDYTTKRVDYNDQSNKSEQDKYKPEEEKAIAEPEKVEIVNNVYIKSESDDNDNVFHKVVLDKVKDNTNTYDSSISVSKYKDISKVIDVKTHKKTDETETDTADVVNNIYISHDVEPEVPDINNDKTLHVFVYDKDQIDNTISDTPARTDDKENDDFEKFFEIKNYNVKPHGLLSMPRRKNVFNIFVKPIKIFDSKEILYE